MSKQKKVASVKTTEQKIENKKIYNPYWVFAGITTLIFLAYSQIWQNGFVWDDEPYITINNAVKEFNVKSLLLDFHVGNYHPLTMLSLGLEYLLVGENPTLFHFNNLLLHSLNSFILFKISEKLNFNNTLSIILTVLFAIHPLHVESVAWAAERKDVLYTFFLFLSFYYYLIYSQNNSKKIYVLSIVFFILSCLSKGMAVVLPALLLITDWWLIKKPLSVKNLTEKIPYFAITLFFAYLATTAQKDAGADASSVINAAYTFSERFRIVCYSFLFYWTKTIFPVSLLPFYPYPSKATGSLPALFNLAVPVLIVFFAAVYWFGKKNPKIWWAVGFFIIAISTVIQILPVGSAIVADRYYYLSSVGPLFLMAYSFSKIYEKSDVFKVLVGLILMVFTVMTFFQTANWKNGLTLFKPAEKAYPEDAMIVSNLGWYYLGQKDFLTAKAYLIKADNNGFKNADVCRSIGSMYLDEGDYKNSILYLEKAQLFLPKSPRTDWLLALAYSRTNEFEKALPYATKAVSEAPENVDYLNSLAQVLLGLKQYEKSNETYAKVLSLEPENWDAYLNISYSHRLRGDLNTEIKLLEELLNKNSSYLPAYRNIGVTLSEIGNHEKAVDYWKKATVYDTTGDYEYNIGINYANRGQIEMAKDWYIKSAKKGKPEAQNILRNNGVQW
jgi:protein O-mannosyl-transferase